MKKLTDYTTDLYVCHIQPAGTKLVFKIMNKNTGHFDMMLLPILYMSYGNFGSFECGDMELIFYTNDEGSEIYLTEETFDAVLNDYLNPSL